MSCDRGITADIQCPFFRSLGTSRPEPVKLIVCASPVKGAASVSLRFESLSRRYSYILWHCKAVDGAGCPLYRAIMEEVERRGDRGVL